MARVSVGMDCRVHSPELEKGVVEGLMWTGCHVFRLGVVPTPVLYFSVVDLGLDGGVMVTASHNPPEYNGFKLCVGVKTLFGDKIQELKRMIENGDFEKGEGSLKEVEGIVERYISYILKNVDVKGRLKVGVDGGNGTVGPVAVRLFEEMGVEVHPIFCEMDGTFPNHHPDPVVEENMRFLKDLVTSRGLDVGFGYDGDGDRLGVLDEKGNVIHGDMLILIFARDILRRFPGAKVIGEVKCSQVLYDTISKWGGRPIMWKTGHSYIKEKMEKEGALLAGEMSGHMFFRDRYFGFDDAIYASARLLEILSREERSLSELLSDVPKMWASPEIRVDCPDDVKFRVVDRLKEVLPRGKSVVDIDGIRVVYHDGSWALVRASNTQPALVLRFEAPTRERLEEISNCITSLVKEKIKEESKVCLVS